MRAPRLKVATIVGTRPEIIRLSRVMAALDEATEHLIIHTGQNFDYELSEVFFRELGLPAPTRCSPPSGRTRCWCSATPTPP